MHHRPECGGPSADRPYYDALAEATANIVRARELEAEAEQQRQRRDALENQIMRTGLARGDREQLLQRQAADAPRLQMLSSSTSQRQMLPPAPSAGERDLLHPQERIRRAALQPRTPKNPRSSR